MTPADAATALYYTLSTIAQTLAGALAILVAVVLFKLAMLRTSIDAAKDTLRSQSIPPAVYWPIMRDSGFEAMAERVREGTAWHIHQNTDLRRICEAAVAAHQDWSLVNRRLYITLAATVTDIGLCFIALPFTPRIAPSTCASGLVLVAAVALGIICLGLYVRLIAAMVRRPE